MPWLVVALLAPALSAFGSYIDKHILSAHGKSGGVGSIVIFCCLFSVIIIPISFFLGNEVFSVSLFQSNVLIVNGMLAILAVMMYLHAIDRHNVLLSIPILQITPVVAFALGYLVLGETLTLRQMMGSLIIILGAVLFSLEINSWRNITLKGWSLVFVFGASIPFALSGVIFKWAALDIGYWTTQFWEYVGIAIFGFVLFAAVRTYRESFLSVFRDRLQRARVIGLNFGAETIMVTSELVLNFATLLAPIALVYVVNSFNSVFIFTYGLIAALLFPHVMKGISWTRLHLAQRVLTIAIMAAGAYMLYL